MKELIKKVVNRETIMYLIFGVLTTLVNWVVYRIFDVIFGGGNAVAESASAGAFDDALNTFAQKGAAGIIAWFAAVTFAYVTNRIFVFSERAYGFKGVALECGRFFGARVLTGIIEILGVPFLIVLGLKAQVFGLDVAKLIISVIIIVLNYVFSKLFVFKKDKEKEA
ncbi:MAG: GtrA family protein [Lachnospiraceae bacterium]|nr:GtrA family protein [Lachnospiraceae bacterium]MBP5249821.1 GtrA family protein [Lachnospiraceae bacterium]